MSYPEHENRSFDSPTAAGGPADDIVGTHWAKDWPHGPNSFGGRDKVLRRLPTLSIAL